MLIKKRISSEGANHRFRKPSKLDGSSQKWKVKISSSISLFLSKYLKIISSRKLLQIKKDCLFRISMKAFFGKVNNKKSG